MMNRRPTTMSHSRPFVTSAALALVAALASGCDRSVSAERAAASAPGGDDCCAHESDAEKSKATVDKARIETDIPDVVLTDQFGKTHRFYTDLVKGKLVLMNSIYTSCAGTCPMQTTVFAGAQHRLRNRLGENFSMISITLDPVNDTPEKLKAFAARFNAHDDWLFLTGPPQDVTTVLQAMDLWSADPAEHLPFCSVGNDETGVWMKVLNLGSPDEIVAKLDHVSKLDPATFSR